MKLSHIFKAILLLLLPCFLLAQYPNNPVKSRLGWQTTGDGLVYRGSGAPAYSPGTLFNAWMYLDTTNYALYMYRNFQWTKLPLVNNGLTLDGSYVQLGGTLVENTQVERSTYTLDFGKISGTNFGYASFYGTDPHYFGVLTKKDGTESGLTIGNKLWGFEVDDSDHTFQLNGSRFGFDATYLGTLGVSQFKMDSTNFFIRGLPSFASHAAADTGTSAYQMYMIDNSRRIYVNQGTATSDILGTGTATRIPIWTSTNALGDSPILYNSTTKRTTWDSPGVIELPMGTDAQRPSPATTSDFWYNTTSNGIEWYNGTRWAKGLESTFNRGTATRVSFFDANGQVTESANLTYTGTRFQTGGSIRIGFNNATNDTASIEKVIDVNSKIIRFNAPGGPGNFGGGFVFRGGQNGTINTANTFRIYAPGTTASGSVYVGNVAEGAAQAGNPTTIFGVLNKITSTTAFDAAINLHPNETGAGANYSLALGKQFGIFIGNQYATSTFTSFNTAGVFGIYIGYQRQPLTSGFGSSMVLSAHGEGASTTTEVMRLQGKDGNICLSCTNAQYQLYTEGTGAYGIPRGTVAQRPTIIASTTPIRFNTDSTAVEYGESVGTWRQLATRAYARSLVSGLITSNIYTANGSLTEDRTLHGAGYTLRMNANTIFRDSLKIGNLIEPSDADSIVITKGGWIGKQKFLLKNYRDSIRTYKPNGFFSDKFASGFMSSRNRNTNLFYADTTGFVEMSNRNTTTGITSAIYAGVANGGRYITIRQSKNGRLADFAFSPSGFDYTTSSLQYIIRGDSFGIIQMGKYGTGIVTPTYTTTNRSNYIAQFATNGTVLDLEIKRDTTVYIVDTDLDWSAAITTAQISRRYNRVIFLMTTTAAAGSDSDLTLHTPDVNLMQVEYLIRSTDEAGGFSNKIVFGSSNAVDSTNGLVTNYFPSAGQGVGIRAGLRSGVYKYYYY